jgi:hypothetical protein
MAMVMWNGSLLWPLPRPNATQTKVSVLIPARNEAANIGALLDTLVNQPTIDAEFIILDDQSTDATAAIVQDYARRDPRVRLITGQSLPSGWTGKNFACQQLANAATGDLLLFLDADVRLEPEALSRLTHHMERHPALAMLSGVPRQLTGSLAEKLVTPLIAFLIMGYLPLGLARLSTAPAFGAGVGQAVLVRRDAYLRIGGHGAVKTTMHDGIKLARALRQQGLMTDVAALHDIVSCRMYDNLSGVWRGFAKNAHEGMAQPVPIAVWTILLGVGHVLPWLLLPFASGVAFWVLLKAVLLSLGSRLLTSLPRRESVLGALLHPVGILLILAINYWALLAPRAVQQQGWRGRTYPVDLP